ncbi:MAG: cytochrome c [Nitrospinota bacterium]|nr:cytochrome c [Nitrospinota bacterium]
MKPPYRLMAVAMAAIWLAGCPGGAKAPEAYSRCVKCHGLPGGGHQKGGPDLAESTLGEEDFARQVTLGSRWKEKDGRISQYKWKEMPPQTGVSDQDIKRIYKFIRSGKN